MSRITPRTDVSAAQELPTRRARRDGSPWPLLGSWWWIVVALVSLLAVQAGAVQIQDVARLRGAEGLPVVGVGLVTGLNGTGDQDLGPSHRMAREVIMRLADDTMSVAEMDGVESVALVMIHARIPESGAVAGDRLDVVLSTVGSAESIEGGYLELAIMHAPVPGQRRPDPGQPLPPGTGIYGLASGQIIVDQPEASPTVGRVRAGLHVTRDVVPNVINRAGQIELVLNQANASWPVAKNLAALVNGLGPLGQDADIARAISPKSVIVQLPEAERRRPAAFISRILESYIDASQVTSGARVSINQTAETIVIDADVEFTPVALSVRGLKITGLRPAPDPETLPPTEVNESFVALDPQARANARLQDLVDAFNLLDIPFADQANAIRELHRSGNLHAQLEEY